MRKVLAVVALSFCLVGCPGPQKTLQLPLVIMVFADVTHSLEGEEFDAVNHAIIDLFDRVPENTTVFVYPVGAVMAYAKPLIEQRLPLRANDSMKALKEDAAMRETLGRQTVESLTSFGEKLDRRVPSSCLTGALVRAADDIASLRSSRIEVVIICDMVEDCNPSITNKLVQLNHVGIDREIAAARDHRKEIADLRQAEVFFIYPASIESGISTSRKRPHPHELKEFWSAVMSHCNAKGSPHFLAGPGLYHLEWKSVRQAVVDRAGKKVS